MSLLPNEVISMKTNSSYSNDDSIDDHRLSVSSDTSDTSMSTFDDSNATIDSQSISQNIRVVARIRPLSSKEKREHSKETLASNIVTNSIRVDQNRTFVFDKVFQSSATQGEVYEHTAGDLIQNHLFKGFNVTVLAYGQTGSGKTHTIFGANGNRFTSKLNEEEDGIIPRAVHELFNRIKSNYGGADGCKVEMSFLEIYNEEAKDLLASDSNPLELSIRESVEGVVVRNLTRHSVISPQEVAALMVSAAEKRSVASTLMNEVSSRSHAICTLYMNMSPENAAKESGENISAKLTLVDLAGSERVKKTGAEGMRLKEGININKGLFVLGQVVSALSELGQQGGSTDTSSFHVNYRDSKLTRLLQDSLGGNSRTVMVACVSPADSNVEESINTLRYAERTRNIKNSAVRNVIPTNLSPVEAAALRKENQMLKLKLVEAQSKLNANACSNTVVTEEVLKKLCDKFSNADVLPTCFRSGINGLNMNEIDTVTKLMLHCTAMEEKARQFKDKAQSAHSDTLKASLNADKWQLKCENLLAVLKKHDITELDLVEDDAESESLVDKLRKEIMSLKERLCEAGIDAEISRATAAAMLNGKGDISVAETLVLVDSTHDDDHIEDSASLLRAELVAVSGSIEQKEFLFQNANQDRESLEALRSHFEGALKALQEEVGILSSERETLISQIQDTTKPKNEANIKGLKDRIFILENRMKELKQKAAEHSKALKLREIAEQKVQKLEAEITEDKKKRADLQRKLKEESAERRNERKEAQINAAKYLRDSNRIQRELSKVKESAARQETVLRRKAEQALFKQQRLEEQNRKRARATSSKGDISQERMNEINVWIENELKNNSKLTFASSAFWQELDLPELQHVSKHLFQRIMTPLHKDKDKPEKSKKDTIKVESWEVFDCNDDDEVANESSDDSDWSPDTPLPVKKKQRKQDSLDTKEPEEEENTNEDDEDYVRFNKMTVAQLRELLRQSGLTISGKKAELVKRLMYSARAKKALVSPTATGGELGNIISSAKKISPNVEVYMNSAHKLLGKRPVSSMDVLSSSKKAKLTQETISSSLRKGFPISSSSRSTALLSSQSTLRKKSPTADLTPGLRKKSPTADLTPRLRPTAPTTSAVASTFTKRTPPKEAFSKTLKKRSPFKRRSPLKSSNRLNSAGSSSSNSLKLSSRSTVLRQSPKSKPSRNASSVSNEVTFDPTVKKERIIHTHTNPLSTITNSAKKRKSNRRLSMKKSVNKALLQLEQLEKLI